MACQWRRQWRTPRQWRLVWCCLGWDKQKACSNYFWSRAKWIWMKYQNILRRERRIGNGKIIESTSYQLILGACLDYKNKKSILEAKRRGVIIKSTPKYHCELAGGGIEYSWGFAKLRYRRVYLWRTRILQWNLGLVSLRPWALFQMIKWEDFHAV